MYKNTPLSEHFQTSIEKSLKQANAISLTHKYMAAQFHESRSMDQNLGLFHKSTVYSITKQNLLNKNCNFYVYVFPFNILYNIYFHID